MNIYHWYQQEFYWNVIECCGLIFRQYLFHWYLKMKTFHFLEFFPEFLQCLDDI